MRNCFEKLSYFLVCGLLALSACTGRGKNDAASDTIYLNLGGEPTTLNPITGTDGYNFDFVGYVYDSLMSRNVDTYDWDPGIAEKYEISPDGTTFTFTIRKDAKWTDGQPVTAEDVKFSFDSIRDPKYNAANRLPYYENIDKAEIIDPNHVRFTTKQKYFENFNAVAGMNIVPKHIYGNPDEGVKINKTAMGSGPYKMAQYDQGQRIVLEKNPDWWGNHDPSMKGQANFPRIVLRFTKEETIAVEMLKKGELDFEENMSPEAYMKKAVGPEFDTKVLKVQVENKEPKPFGYIGWNLNRDLFKEKNTRVALAMLMNRPLMIEKFRFDMSLPATGPWYQQSDYADHGVKPLPFDPVKAAELLKAAGWSGADKTGVLSKTVDGKKVDFHFTVLYSNPDSEKYYTLYQEDLKKAGIQMELKQVEFNTLLRNIDDKNFDAVAMSWGGGSVDIDPKQIWHSASAVKGGSNFISYKNPEVDKLIDEARQELDRSKRIPILQKVYRMIADDAPYVFMFNNKYALYVVNQRIIRPVPTRVYGIGSGYWSLKQ